MFLKIRKLVNIKRKDGNLLIGYKDRSNNMIRTEGNINTDSTQGAERLYKCTAMSLDPRFCMKYLVSAMQYKFYTKTVKVFF